MKIKSKTTPKPKVTLHALSSPISTSTVRPILVLGHPERPWHSRRHPTPLRRTAPTTPSRHLTQPPLHLLLQNPTLLELLLPSFLPPLRSPVLTCQVRLSVPSSYPLPIPQVFHLPRPRRSIQKRSLTSLPILFRVRVVASFMLQHLCASLLLTMELLLLPLPIFVVCNTDTPISSHRRYVRVGDGRRRMLCRVSRRTRCAEAPVPRCSWYFVPRIGW